MNASNVVQIADYLEPPVKSQYELYALPFFDREHLSTWAVKPTGDYAADCATGRRYAIEFLKSCDGTIGWEGILAQIVGDMIGAGAERWPGGGVRNNGVVVGFMSTIGEALCHRKGLLESRLKRPRCRG